MQGNVLVVNCGSSSVKFAVIVADSGSIVAEGLAERLYEGNPELKFNPVRQAGHSEPLGDNADHHQAMNAIVTCVQRANLQNTIVAVGHRVVHGGESFAESVIIDDEVLQAIVSHQHLAPLHNPANLEGITAARSAFQER